MTAILTSEKSQIPSVVSIEIARGMTIPLRPLHLYRRKSWETLDQRVNIPPSDLLSYSI